MYTEVIARPSEWMQSIVTKKSVFTLENIADNCQAKTLLRWVSVLEPTLSHEVVVEDICDFGLRADGEFIAGMSSRDNAIVWGWADERGFRVQRLQLDSRPCEIALNAGRLAVVLEEKILVYRLEAEAELEFVYPVCLKEFPAQFIGLDGLGRILYCDRNTRLFRVGRDGSTPLGSIAPLFEAAGTYSRNVEISVDEDSSVLVSSEAVVVAPRFGDLRVFRGDKREVKTSLGWVVHRHEDGDEEMSHCLHVEQGAHKRYLYIQGLREWALSGEFLLTLEKEGLYLYHLTSGDRQAVRTPFGERRELRKVNKSKNVKSLQGSEDSKGIFLIRFQDEILMVRA